MQVFYSVESTAGLQDNVGSLSPGPDHQQQRSEPAGDSELGHSLGAQAAPALASWLLRPLLRSMPWSGAA